MKKISIYTTPELLKSSVILGGQPISEGNEVKVAMYCLDTLDAWGWNLEDVMAIALFEGNEEVCRRFIGGFKTLSDIELDREQAVEKLAETFREMLSVGYAETRKSQSSLKILGESNKKKTLTEKVIAHRLGKVVTK